MEINQSILEGVVSVRSNWVDDLVPYFFSAELAKPFDYVQYHLLQHY